MRNRYALILMLVPVLAVGFSACGDASETRETAGVPLQIEDSAGIRILENARPPEGSRLDWRIGPGPAVSIGAVEGEDPYLFTWPRDATKLGDGRIVVADYGSAQLRVFDGASGTHVATWGGRGEGPGEFLELWDVERVSGDSIIAWGHATMSLFDPDGNHVRTTRLEKHAPTPVGPRPVWPVAAMDDGSLLASLSRAHIDTVLVEIWDTEGNLRGSLGTHLAYVPLTWVGGVRSPEIFGWDLKLAPWGDLAIVTPSERYEIRAFSTDGALARIIRMEHVPRAPTDVHLESYIEVEVYNQVPDALADMMEGDAEEMRAQARRELRNAPVAEHFPAFASVMTDRAGHLWVEEYEVIGEEAEGVLWAVFDPDGRVLGFVETPEGLEVYEIGEDYILGRVQDELEVDYIQVWPLERIGG